MSTGVLGRVIMAGIPAAVAERCDFCSADLDPSHRHLLDTETHRAACVCLACSVLFDKRAASRGHYRLVPQRRLQLGEVDTATLRFPVGLAFVAVRDDGRIVASYPSPAGATEWEVDEPAWRSVVDGCPQLAGLEPEVEALLVNYARGRRQAWIVPIDDCFRLVSVIRGSWRGLSGGSRVWPEIDAFFDNLTDHQQRRA